MKVIHCREEQKALQSVHVYFCVFRRQVEERKYQQTTNNIDEYDNLTTFTGTTGLVAHIHFSNRESAKQEYYIPISSNTGIT